MPVMHCNGWTSIHQFNNKLPFLKISLRSSLTSVAGCPNYKHRQNLLRKRPFIITVTLKKHLHGTKDLPSPLINFVFGIPDVKINKKRGLINIGQGERDFLSSDWNKYAIFYFVATLLAKFNTFKIPKSRNLIDCLEDCNLV